MEKKIEKLMDVVYSDKFQKRVIKAVICGLVVMEIVGYIYINL